MIFYRPSPKLYASDSWCFKKGDLWYVYTCQGDGIGVATSPDLTSFEYQGRIIEGYLYRGDTFAWRGGYRMLYAQGNSIRLAESDDLLNWKESREKPVMRLADPRWYDGATYKESIRRGNACRDPSLVDDACTDEWVYCCFAADTGRGDHYRRACVGLARSRNLVDWEYLPPLFSPGLYTLMDVPQVHKIGSKYFLLWLTCPWYGFRTDEDVGQRAQHGGETMMHYAVADGPLGPYRLPENPTLFRGLFSPYVAELLHDGRQVMLLPTMFNQGGEEWDNRDRCGLMPAMPVRQAKGKPDKLEVCFPERIRGYFPGTASVVDRLRINTPEKKPKDVTKNATSVSFTHTSLRLAELTNKTGRDFIIDVECRVKSGRVGLVSRYDPRERAGCAILIDPNRKEMQFAELAPMGAFGMILKVRERHNITSRIAPSFTLSVIHSHDYQQVFADGVLAATFSFARRDAGRLALMMENATGRCIVKNIRMRKPDVP